MTEFGWDCGARAIVSTLTWWLKNDRPYSAQQMEEYLRTLFGETAPGG